MQEIAEAKRHPNRSRRNSIAKREKLRERAFNAILWGYGLVLIPVLVMLFLQGFRAWGFNLPEKLVYGLAIAVIGEIAGFTYIVLRFLFPNDKK